MIQLTSSHLKPNHQGYQFPRLQGSFPQLVPQLLKIGKIGHGYGTSITSIGATQLSENQLQFHQTTQKEVYIYQNEIF